MSRFYGELYGRAGIRVTREGTAGSGLTAHARGWNVGVYVICEAEGDKDVIKVYRTGGSNNPDSRELIAVVEGPTEVTKNEKRKTLRGV